VPIRSTGYKRPLFFMPEQRGDVLAYRQLVSSLDQDRPVYGIQCVGLDGRETPRTSIEAVATDCIEALRRVQPHGPYLLAGYCFGGVVAFEVGAQLVAAGEEVEFLGIIDATPFGRGGALMAHLRPTLARRLTWQTTGELRRKVAYVRSEIRWRLNAEVTERCVALGIQTPRAFVDVHAANRIGTKNYVAPDAPLAVTFFRASDGTIEADELRRQRWEMVAQKGVEMRLVSGHLMNHFQIVRSAYAPRLASMLDECMAELA
jgi:aspartate racemase